MRSKGYTGLHFLKVSQNITLPCIQKKEKLFFPLGRDIAGETVWVNLETLPHLLIGGSTGSGKSVCVNSVLISLLYRATPDEVKFLLIDPKTVELVDYAEIPHLIAAMDGMPVLHVKNGMRHGSVVPFLAVPDLVHRKRREVS